MRVKINHDSRNQTIEKLRGKILRLAQVNKTVPRAQKKKTQARANCSAVPTQLALCLRLAIDL